MKNKNLYLFVFIVFGLVTFLLFLLNMITISHIIQIIIAIGALATAYYARRSFEKTNQMFEEERLSKRGELASSEKQGGLIDDNKQLIINLTNYGINTIKGIVVDVLVYTKDSMSKTVKKQTPIVNYISHSTNPLPHNQPFHITVESNNPLPDPGSNPYYVIARIKYFDVILDHTFDNEYFFWELGGRNILGEIKPKEVMNIKDILKFDKEFWTFISKDFEKRQKILEESISKNAK